MSGIVLTRHCSGSLVHLLAELVGWVIFFLFSFYTIFSFFLLIWYVVCLVFIPLFGWMKDGKIVCICCCCTKETLRCTRASFLASLVCIIYLLYFICMFVCFSPIFSYFFTFRNSVFRYLRWNFSYNFFFFVYLGFFIIFPVETKKIFLFYFKLYTFLSLGREKI